MEINDIASGLQHIGIPTNDMDASVAFYEALGFNNKYEVMNGPERVVFMELKNLAIELYQNNQAVMKDGAIDHIAIDVNDINKAYEIIKKKNLKILNEITFLHFWNNGIKYFIIEGPNKERLEFNEIL